MIEKEAAEAIFGYCRGKLICVVYVHIQPMVTDGSHTRCTSQNLKFGDCQGVASYGKADERLVSRRKAITAQENTYDGARDAPQKERRSGAEVSHAGLSSICFLQHFIL